MGLPELAVQLSSAILGALETNEAMKRLEKGLSSLAERVEKERPEFMDYRQAAEHLKLSKTTLQQYVSAGRIPHYKIGAAVRFERTEMDAWMASKRVDKGGHGGRKNGRATRESGIGVSVG